MLWTVDMSVLASAVKYSLVIGVVRHIDCVVCGPEARKWAKWLPPLNCYRTILGQSSML